MSRLLMISDLLYPFSCCFFLFDIGGYLLFYLCYWTPLKRILCPYDLQRHTTCFTMIIYFSSRPAIFSNDFMETLKNATTNKIPKYNNTFFSLLDGIRSIGNRRSIAFRAVHEFFMLFFLSSCSLTLSYYWTARYTHSVLFLPMVRGSDNQKKEMKSVRQWKTKRQKGMRGIDKKSDARTVVRV